MSKNVIVPTLGESVSEATIATWHKQKGDQVQIDELLVELETEKVTLEVNASSSGVLKEIKYKEGDTVKIGDILAVIDESASGSVSIKNNNDDKNTDINFKDDNDDDVSKADNSRSSKLDSEYAFSPAAKKIASENNISASDIQGSGVDGRIMKGDILNHLENGNNQASQATDNAGNDTISEANNSSINSNDRVEERVKMSRLRKTIATRLKESQNTAAILTTFNEVDMTNVMNLRKKYKDIFHKTHDVKLGFMSFFVKAATSALMSIPTCNAQIDGDDIIYRNYCDIGVAVGTEKGLVVPIVRDAQNLSFAEIESSIIDLANKARNGKLSMSDLSGGTFSITNGGVYGSMLSTPIINPPQTAIIGLHNIVQRPVVVDGKIEIRPIMYLALSYDHRIIDGKDAVTFLVKIKDAIENPERLLLQI